MANCICQLHSVGSFILLENSILSLLLQFRSLDFGEGYYVDDVLHVSKEKTKRMVMMYSNYVFTCLAEIVATCMHCVYGYFFFYKSK